MMIVSCIALMPNQHCCLAQMLVDSLAAITNSKHLGPMAIAGT